MYVGKQRRITLDNNTHYYVDLVFYNKILRSYVLIDLKMDDMKAEYVGQMNIYISIIIIKKYEINLIMKQLVLYYAREEMR